jgi:hypothetical protein
VLLLSYIISEEGMPMDSSKIGDMLSWNALTSIIDSRSSLGLVGYYQKIVEGFLKTTKPMSRSLRKD